VAGFGTNFTAPVPSDSITSRPQASHIEHPYGSVFVFYAACAGDLRKAFGADSSQEPPVGCFDPATGEALGQEDFEFGYFPIYVYNDLINHNPILQSVRLGDSDSSAPCVNRSECSATKTCGHVGVCIPRVQRCAESDGDDCPSYALVPSVDRSSAERAVTAHLTESTAPLETLWVSYFATSGSYDKDLRVVQDPGAGWEGDISGRWRAQAPAGQEVRLWAVLRDDRNGVQWLYQDVFVE
jgi:hypothetical protein